MLKIINFPDLLPKSIREIIPDNAPTHNYTHENCASWLEIYECVSPYYRTSLFYKGHLLALSPQNEHLLEPACFIYNMKIYKIPLKRHLQCYRVREYFY